MSSVPPNFWTPQVSGPIRVLALVFGVATAPFVFLLAWWFLRSPGGDDAGRLLSAACFPLVMLQVAFLRSPTSPRRHEPDR